MTRSGERKARGPGRRPGAPDTRGAIVAVARESFATRGYDSTTLRGVAREAGVDPALLHHYFAGKHDLFLQAMDVPFDPSELVETVFTGDPEGMGERLTRAFLHLWEQPETRTRLVGFVRAVIGSESSAAMLREAFSTFLFEQAAAHLTAPDVRLRLNAVASQLVGLALARYVVRFEPMASADVDDLVRLVGPNLQRYLTGDL